MKTLMIGMDGAQLETFRRGWTPYITSLIELGKHLQLKEDLISRGWVEILTGEHGITTGGLYDRPALNGTHEWSTKFKINDIPGLGTKIKPIWQVLNERDYRVGIMNVPTTSPAPEVKGFFVSGGGGGTGVMQKLTPELCHPNNIIHTLNELGYIPDERPPSLFGEKKLFQPKNLFGRLEEMVRKRTSAFITLAKKYKIDFGFVVYRSSVLAEIFCLPELHRLLHGLHGVNHELVNAIKHFYQHLDEQVQLLVESFPDTNIVMVSDHGTTVVRWHVNINTFLCEHGYQTTSSKKKGIYRLINHFKTCMPMPIRAKLGRMSKIRKAYVGITPFDEKKSLAFCMVMGDWVPGIYINDRKRFGGPVNEKDIHDLSQRIAQAFNSEPFCIAHGLAAKVKPDTKAAATHYFPDITFDMPDGYLITNMSQPVITESKLPDGPLDVASIVKGPFLCCKAHTPLAVVVKHDWKVEMGPVKRDLRLIYDHIVASYDQ